jgi:hypothetical protein
MEPFSYTPDRVNFIPAISERRAVLRICPSQQEQEQIYGHLHERLQVLDCPASVVEHGILNNCSKLNIRLIGDLSLGWL